MKTIRICIWVACLLGLNMAKSQVSQQVTALQYFYNTDPGVGTAGNGAIISVTPTSDLNQTFSLTIPGSLGKGFHHLYLRAKDEIGRWSVAERRMIYITELASGTRNIVAYHWFVDMDPGVGMAGNGAIVPVTSTASFNNTVSLVMPGSLTKGFHQLYIRTKDESGRWSLAERRMFYITELASGTRNIVACQWYVDNDPGVGLAGNGAVIPVASTASYNNTLSLVIPGSLTNGIHQLYIRTKDESGRWSLAERRMFYITELASGTQNIAAYQWYVDNDPGVGIPGNGAVVSVTSTPLYNSTVSIVIPGSLTAGIHQLYLRAKDDDGRWSIAERRMFYIRDVVDQTSDMVSLEYYFDVDPGAGNANPYPIPQTSDFNSTITIGVPCLSTGTHYFYVRALDTQGRWSIIERDTLTVTSGIEPSVVTPAGPLSICEGDNIILSTTPVLGVAYQWVESGVPISGETNPSLTVTESGTYALRSICGSFVVSNEVMVTVQTQNTYYADADNDGYGNTLASVLGCVQPAGYVTNDDDCDDADAAVHPNASEACNLVDDDCDGNIDEGVQLNFYADTDNDGYGDIAITTQACASPSGYVSNDDDCDDSDPDIHPGASETCNLADDDCNGSVDEGVQLTFYVDADSDGYGNPSSYVLACTAPAGHVNNDTDCDDTDNAVFPSAIEICNGLDDNCDGTTDEGFIYSIPPTTIISSAGSIFCSGLTTTLSLDGGLLGTAADWYWYEGGCGDGSSIGTGTSILVTPSAGNQTYYVRAEGACGNTLCTSISLLIQSPPEFISCPMNMTIFNTPDACSAEGIYSLSIAGVPSPSLSYEFTDSTTAAGPGSGSGSEFNVGTTDILLLAENICGMNECAFEIQVSDTEDPVISNCPVNIETTVEPGQWGAHVTWTDPGAIDNCEILSLTSSFEPGHFFVVGSTPVIYTASDIHGNTSTCSFTVTIDPPQVLGDPNVSIFANDIQFSDDHPDPGSVITVYATVHNPSNYNVSAFTCRLFDQATELYYPNITLPGLNVNQSIQISWVIETPAVPGFIPLQVIIDGFDVLEESNELDNQAVRPYFNGEFSFAGQIVVTADAIPSTQTAGTGISICGNAYYDDVAVSLEDTSVAGAQVTVMIVETNQNFSGTTDANGNFCISFLTSNTPGTYHFLVEVTDFTLTGDTTGEFLLTEPVITCPRDLSLNLSLYGSFLCDQKYHIVQGSSLTGSVTVYNSCDAVSTPTTLFISLPDGTPVPGPFTIPALISGQSYTVNLPAMAFNTVGITFINATVDYYNVVNEMNEMNNSTSYIIQVHPPIPDIVAGGGHVSQAYQCVSSEVTFFINNEGGAPTGDFEAELQIYRDNILETTMTQVVSSISGLCGQLISFSFSPSSAGQYYFNLYCDPDNLLDEISETNNTGIRPHFYLECGTDITFYRNCGKIDVKPTDPENPGMLDIYTTLQNRGHLAVSQTFSVVIEIEGNIYPVTVNPPILAGGLRDVSISVPAPVHGNNQLNISLDDGNVINEYDEGNNMTSDNLCWDFEITNLQCNNLPAMETTQLLCQPEMFETRINNLGLYEASELDVLFEIMGPGLPAGWNYLGIATTFINRTCDCPLGVSLPNIFYYPQTGTYTVRMTADPYGFYSECNEGNNVLSVNIEILESPDYAVYSEYIDPSLLNPALNEAVTFNLTYKNTGCSGTSASELYLEVDGSPLDSLLASPLIGDETNTYAMSQSWSSGLPGLHIVRSFIDHDGTIAETNELNNEASRAIIVGRAPDFVVASISASDTTPVSGQIIQLTAEIINDGDVSAEATLQISYVNSLDQITVLHQQIIQLDSMESMSHSFSWQVIDPTVRIVAKVQDANLVETDYTNNEKQVQLTPFTGTLTKTDVQCSSLDLGSLNVLAVGGQPPYYAQWSNGYTGLSIDVPSGTYSVSVSDDNGSMVILYDTIMDLALPVTWYLDNDNDGYGNPSVSDYTCIQPQGYVGTGTDCNDSNSTAYPDASELPDGMDNDCDGLIDEGLNLLNVEVGDCEVVYFGYEGQACQTLLVSASGGTGPYTYTWSHGATTQSTTICPGETSIYAVTVTDFNGYTAEDNVTVQVIDVTCGNNNNKVLVCHIPPGNPENAHVICIAPSAIPAHLEHGCYIGICDAPDPCEVENQSATNSINEKPVESYQEVNLIPKPGDEPIGRIEIIPNPATHILEVMYAQTKASMVLDLMLMDMSGQIVLRNEYTEDEIVDFEEQLDVSRFAPGMYVLQLITTTGILTERISVVD